MDELFRFADFLIKNNPGEENEVIASKTRDFCFGYVSGPRSDEASMGNEPFNELVRCARRLADRVPLQVGRSLAS